MAAKKHCTNQSCYLAGRKVDTELGRCIACDYELRFDADILSDLFDKITGDEWRKP